MVDEGIDMTVKMGVAGEKHDHSPQEFGCTFFLSQPCRRNHQCCFYCELFYKCQEGRCMQAFFAMKNQPHPSPFKCRHAKLVIDLAWDLVFEHGSENY